jgi:hypothetical protein
LTGPDVVTQALQAARVPGKPADEQDAQFRAQERARAPLRLARRPAGR